MNPKQDGVTHINIYSKGKTDLGRFLTNFAHSPITTEDGNFDSIEGYWYWLSNRKKVMRTLHGHTAKKVGKQYKRVVSMEEEEFQKKIIEACWIKIHSNQVMLKILMYSVLPFEHYYVYKGIPKDAGSQWIIGMWELFRSHLKNREIPYQKLPILFPVKK